MGGGLQPSMCLTTTQRLDDPPHAVVGRGKGIRYIFVELGKFAKAIEKILDQRESWCYLLKNSDKMSERECSELVKKGKDMGEAVKQLWDISQDDMVLERIEAEEKVRRDHVGQMAWAKKQSREEGRTEGRTEVALKMLERGSEMEFIMECTGLDEKELKRLKAKAS